MFNNTKMLVTLFVLFSIQFSWAQSKIIPSGAILIKVFDKGFFTEGPASSPDGRVFFSDITSPEETGMLAGIIWVYNPETGKTNLYRSPSGMSNGIEFDNKGNMVVCEGSDFGGRRITKTDMKSGKSRIVTAMYNNVLYNAPNDLTVDKNGNIFFTDPKYVGWEKADQPCFGVYRASEDNVKLIIDSLPMPNGIALSPDNKVLYVGVNFEGNTEKNIPPVCKIEAYDLTENGTPVNGRDFLAGGKIIFPDGLTVDKSGNVYIAVRDEKNPGIYIYSDKSDLLDIVHTPEIPSNVTFGKGKDRNTLYITAGKSLYKIKLLSEGI